MKLHFRKFVRRVLDEEIDDLFTISTHEKYDSISESLDWKTCLMLVTAAVLLTLQKYGVNQVDGTYVVHFLLKLFSNEFREACLTVLASPRNSEITRLAYWTMGNIFLCGLIPMAIVRFVFRESLSDYGLKLTGMGRYASLYGIGYAIIFPALILASQSQSFRNVYPFYRLAANESVWPRFLVWELMYAAQFVSIEFLFRGFMIHSARKSLGHYAIFVSMVPYAMIHFQKPFLEALGAIIAGLVLGFMSYRTGSIWLGAALHIAVAWTMDGLALIQVR